MTTHILNDLFCIGSNIHIPADWLALHSFEGDLEFITLHHDLIRMNQRLVHVKDDSFTV